MEHVRSGGARAKRGSILYPHPVTDSVSRCGYSDSHAPVRRWRRTNRRGPGEIWTQRNREEIATSGGRRDMSKVNPSQTVVGAGLKKYVQRAAESRWNLLNVDHSHETLVDPDGLATRERSERPRA